MCAVALQSVLASVDLSTLRCSLDCSIARSSSLSLLLYTVVPSCPAPPTLDCLRPPVPTSVSVSPLVDDASSDYNFDLSQLKPPPSFTEKLWEEDQAGPARADWYTNSRSNH